MKQNDRPAGYLNLQEAAEMIEVHPDSLLRLVRQKKLKLVPHSRPAWRAAKKFWFKRDDVLRAAADRKTLRS